MHEWIALDGVKSTTIPGLAVLAYLFGVTGVWLTLTFAEGVTALLFLPILPVIERRLQRRFPTTQ